MAEVRTTVPLTLIVSESVSLSESPSVSASVSPSVSPSVSVSASALVEEAGTHSPFVLHFSPSAQSSSR